MLRSGNNPIALILVIAISILLITGCAPAGNTKLTEQVQEPLPHPPVPLPIRELKLVQGPIEMYHLVVNPITIETMKTNNDTLISISGLKHKVVEERINNRLQNLYKEMKEAPLPPYRGIKVEIPTGSTLRDNGIRATLVFNYNNILSVVVANQRTYAIHGGMSSRYMSWVETLNFDLYTGDEIDLKSICRQCRLSANFKRFRWYEGYKEPTGR